MSISASSVIIPLVARKLATLAWAGISGNWTARAVGAVFVFGFLLLLLVSIIHA